MQEQIREQTIAPEISYDSFQEYELDNIAANEGISIFYRNKTDEARCFSIDLRRLQHKQKVIVMQDKAIGPPDKRCHFEPNKTLKKHHHCFIFSEL